MGLWLVFFRCASTRNGNRKIDGEKGFPVRYGIIDSAFYQGGSGTAVLLTKTGSNDNWFPEKEYAGRHGYLCGLP
jgi:hypothetical protein